MLFILQCYNLLRFVLQTKLKTNCSFSNSNTVDMISPATARAIGTTSRLAILMRNLAIHILNNSPIRMLSSSLIHTLSNKGTHMASRAETRTHSRIPSLEGMVPVSITALHCRSSTDYKSPQRHRNGAYERAGACTGS